MNTFHFPQPHFFRTNEQLMEAYIKLQESFSYGTHLTIDFTNGAYAEGLDCKGNRWALIAKGVGTDWSHTIHFAQLESSCNVPANF